MHSELFSTVTLTSKLKWNVSSLCYLLHCVPSSECNSAKNYSLKRVRMQSRGRSLRSLKLNLRHRQWSLWRLRLHLSPMLSAELLAIDAGPCSACARLVITATGAGSCGACGFAVDPEEPRLPTGGYCLVLHCCRRRRRLHWRRRPFPS